MRKLSVGALLSLTALAIVFGLVAQAQKDDAAAENSVTLAKLGVSEDQKTQIKALWELKRQAHIQALKDLKILNRLARDEVASEDKIGETLQRLRKRRLTTKRKIRSAEESLIETLPVRASTSPHRLGRVGKRLDSPNRENARKRSGRRYSYKGCRGK